MLWCLHRCNRCDQLRISCQPYIKGTFSPRRLRDSLGAAKATFRVDWSQRPAIHFIVGTLARGILLLKLRLPLLGVPRADDVEVHLRKIRGGPTHDELVIGGLLFHHAITYALMVRGWWIYCTCQVIFRRRYISSSVVFILSQ